MNQTVLNLFMARIRINKTIYFMSFYKQWTKINTCLQNVSSVGLWYAMSLEVGYLPTKKCFKDESENKAPVLEIREVWSTVSLSFPDPHRLGQVVPDKVLSIKLSMGIISCSLRSTPPKKKPRFVVAIWSF